MPPLRGFLRRPAGLDYGEQVAPSPLRQRPDYVGQDAASSVVLRQRRRQRFGNICVNLCSSAVRFY